MTARAFYAAMGGRKMFNGYLFCVLATVMIFPLDGSFIEYVSAVGGVLVMTNAAVAVEDGMRSPATADDPGAPLPEPPPPTAPA